MIVSTPGGWSPSAAASSHWMSHGVGGRSDLPVSGGLAFGAAVVALVVSFLVLAFAWRSSRFTGETSGVPLPGWLARFVDAPAPRGVVVSASLAFTAWVTTAAVFGSPSLVNPTFGVVYVLLWIGLVPAALLFGSIYRLCNPLRWIHHGICRVTGIDPTRGLWPCPERLGLWPAALLLLTFTWLELADPNLSVSLAALRIWFAAVGISVILGAAVFGRCWIEQADPFEVYSSLMARLSPFGRRDDGILVARSPLNNLDSTVPRPGLVAVVSVLFGSTAFDSFKESTRWLSFSQQYSGHLQLLNSAALCAFCLVVLSTFSLASALTGWLGHLARRDLPGQLAHSVVPIVLGYVVAHYLSFFVSTGITTLQQLGDPLTRGWTLTSWLSDVDKYAIYNHPTGLAVTKVLSVIAGHVVGVVAAHDRSVRLLPRSRALVGQLPMLALMMAYTLTGLWLLFSS